MFQVGRHEPILNDRDGATDGLDRDEVSLRSHFDVVQPIHLR